MTPAEQEAILREQREARAASDAERQTRSAEAKARDADARAREAEAEVQEPAQGIPLWWGTWGPGPTAWPGQPAQPATHPVRVVK